MAEVNLDPLFMHTMGKFSYFYDYIAKCNVNTPNRTEIDSTTTTKKCHPFTARSDPNDTNRQTDYVLWTTLPRGVYQTKTSVNSDE